MPHSGTPSDATAAPAPDAASVAEDPYHLAIFQAWACAFGASAVVYLSGPITTGKRLLAAIEEGRPLDTVLPENLADMRETAHRLRQQVPPIVLDPSPLTVAHWSQKHYMLLWRGLIERHAREVRFMPDWEYSRGCAEEFVFATALGIPTLDLEGSAIAPGAGNARLARAIDRLDKSIAGHERLAALASALNTLRGALAGS